MTDDPWGPPPKKKRAPKSASNKDGFGRNKLTDFKLTTKVQLKAHSKIALVDEVCRLQKILREVAVEIGAAQRTKSSELTIECHFTGNITKIVTLGWLGNL